MNRIISIICIVLMLSTAAAPFAVSAAEAGDTGRIRCTLSDVQTPGDTLISAAPTQADGDVVEDGINTNVVTIWIIIVSAVFFAAILAVTVYLAKKNRNAK